MDRYDRPRSRRAFLASAGGAAAAWALAEPLAALASPLSGLPHPRAMSPTLDAVPASGLAPKAVGSAYALVLGAAQDGGMPQAGCYTPACERARTADPAVLAASLGLVSRADPAADPRFYLVDASPDLSRQMDLMAAREPLFEVRADVRRPFDGIFLTHAHMGHYLGLAHLGREALATAPTPVHCTPRMADFLAANGPWSLMVGEGRLDLRPLEPGELRRIDDGLSAWYMLVPHRDEFSDTVAWVFEGPDRTLLYLPDIDRWGRWERDVATVVGAVDVAFLDGTFYSADEVPGRAVEDIPHPLIPDSIARLREVARRTRVVFTHLNNSNPAIDPASPQAAAVLGAGFEIAREGMEVPL